MKEKMENEFQPLPMARGGSRIACREKIRGEKSVASTLKKKGGRNAAVIILKFGVYCGSMGDAGTHAKGKRDWGRPFLSLQKTVIVGSCVRRKDLNTGHGGEKGYKPRRMPPCAPFREGLDKSTGRKKETGRFGGYRKVAPRREGRDLSGGGGDGCDEEGGASGSAFLATVGWGGA